MKEFSYRKIDAFTEGDSLGNPAACLYLEQGQTLTDAEMLSVARQHKGFVSEVVYCAPLPDSAFSLTYYSSECEVDFCGHGTVACMYGLLRERAELCALKEITIHAHKKGALTVFNETAARDAVYITAPAPQHIDAAVGTEEAAERLGLDTGALDASRPVEIINAGLTTLIVPVTALADVVRVFPDERALREFCLKIGVDIILIHALETADARHAAHTRVFAPKFGYLEDPATGSGNSAFGYYLLKHGLWDGGAITVEQGGEDRVFNSVSLVTKEGRVLFGGRAATRIRGVYLL